MYESCHMWMSHVTYEWVMSHVWMSHVTYMNESRHSYEWVMSHIWMSPATYEWVMPHMNIMSPMNASCRIWISHATHMDESRHMLLHYDTHEWISHTGILPHTNESCHIRMSHVNESCRTHEWVMSHIWLRRWRHRHRQSLGVFSVLQCVLQHVAGCVAMWVALPYVARALVFLVRCRVCCTVCGSVLHSVLQCELHCSTSPEIWCS